MNRAGFLKRLFGAAVVAAMPPIVVRQIESLPEPAPPKKDVLEYVEEQIAPYRHLKPIAPDGLLYIYDYMDGLIGISRKFLLQFKQIPILMDYDVDLIPTYHKGLRSWNIITEDINWVVNPEKYFMGNRKLNCILLKDDKKISGNIYISKLEFISPLFDELSTYAEFEGTGELILDSNDYTTATK